MYGEADAHLQRTSFCQPWPDMVSFLDDEDDVFQRPARVVPPTTGGMAASCRADTFLPPLNAIPAMDSASDDDQESVYSSDSASPASAAHAVSAASIPSNITCHCSVCLNPEPPRGARPIRADVRTFDFDAFIASEHWLSGSPSGGFFDVIMMDPPWQLAGQAPSRGVSLLYDQLHDRLIEDMRVNVLQRNGLIFIWVINNKFVRALDMMDTWGYTYLMDIAWVKRTVNRKLAKCHGYYLQHAKETCLVGVKGQLPDNVWNSMSGSDVIYSERRGQSQKPEEMYQLIERIFPAGRFLEIFGRRHNLRPSWTTIGNEV